MQNITHANTNTFVDLTAVEYDHLRIGKVAALQFVLFCQVGGGSPTGII